MPNVVNLVEAIQELKEIENKGITYINDEKDERFVSYRQLYERSLAVLYCLQSKGLLSGQELIFQIENNEIFLYVFWACIFGRMIPVPVSVGDNDEHRMKLFKIWSILNSPYFISNQQMFHSLEKYASVHQEFKDAFDSAKRRWIDTDQLQLSGETGDVHFPEANDIAFIQFSSGSTGDPKGVVLTHDNIVTNVYALNKACNIKPDNRFLSWIPLTHDMGLIAVHLGSIIAGANLYLVRTKLFINNPVLWLKKAHEHQVTSLYSPNFGYKYFLAFFSPEVDYGWDLSSIRYIANGAEPISTQLYVRFMNELAKYGLKKSAMKAVYGLAEASVGVCVTHAEDQYAAVCVDYRSIKEGQKVRWTDAGNKNSLMLVEVGKPIENCLVRICNEMGNTVANEIVGRIQICGRNVTKGYYNDSKATGVIITKDGWLDTGDLGFMREGRLVITGRVKDIIFVNGQNYYPYDIERVAEAFDRKKFWQTAACGVLDRKGQAGKIVLFVIFRHKREEFVKLIPYLRMYILEQTGLYVHHILPVKSLPKTTSGKIQRYKLSEQYVEGEFDALIEELERMTVELFVPAERNETLTATEASLVGIYRKVAGVFHIDIVKDNFVDMGGNSMLLTQVSEQIERIYPGRVTIANLFAYPTIKQLATFIDRDDSLTVPVLPMPEAYFAVDRTEGDGSFFETVLEENLFHRLLRVAELAEVEICDVMLAMYIYLLKEVSEESRIPVQILGEVGVTSIEVDFTQIRDYESFFRLVGAMLSGGGNNPAYSLNDVYGARFLKSDRSILPFFCRSGNRYADTRLVHVSDLIVKVRERKDSIEVLWECSRRLNREKVGELLHRYLWYITELVNKYSVV
jgi:fatty-acyl-CoA synthase